MMTLSILGCLAKAAFINFKAYGRHTLHCCYDSITSEELYFEIFN